MSEQEIAGLAGAAVLAAVHLVAGRLRFLDATPRSRWLSAFGGIAVAYVFVHLLPELAEGQEAIDAEHGTGPLLDYLEHHAYLLALAGLALFYAVEHHSMRSRTARGGERTGADAFWLSIASFAVYNAVVGYLLLREELEPLHALVLYTVAMAVHFAVNDHGLRDHHKDAYDRVGRWVIAAAVPAGWAVGMLTEVSERAIGMVIAFIGGGVILNVLKEELPRQREARVLPFVAGAAGYTAILQLL